MTVTEVADAVVIMLIQACFIICPFSPVDTVKMYLSWY